MRIAFGIPATLLMLVATQVIAEPVSLPASPPAAWKNECLSCHAGFPPQMMRKSDWKQLMSSLDKHFGTDASVAAKDHAAIAAFLDEYGVDDTNEMRAATEMRVTTTRFFQREHRQFIPDLFKHPEVKRASNCEACHKSGGEYNHTVTLPADMKLPPRPPRGQGGPPPGAPPPGTAPTG